ncbi:glycosyltransferase family 1 protein [Candidatus Woesearchaeota archaeon]|nr:MAG: glycosyltransferase family 1 protein [Candidatus Woesearchaeota archaeon]
MRFLVFSHYFWPYAGGLEKYVLETSARLVERGHEVVVVTASLPDLPSRSRIRRVNVLRVPCWHLFGKTFAIPKPRAWSLLRGMSPDVVITHTRFVPASFLGAIFAKRFRIPRIHIEHGATHTGKKPFIYSVNILYDHTIGWFVLKSADVIAAVSDAARAFVKHLCGRGSVLLHNAINTSFFHPVRAKKPVKGDMILFIGRLIEAKGVQDLFEAARGIDATVVIAGSGNYERELARIAPDNVVFLGEVNEKQVRSLLSCADVFVNPSYAEGLPTSVLEAGAMGVPTIATDVGGTREIIDDGVNGYLVPKGDVEALRDRIVRVLKNKRKAKMMAARLRSKVVKRFDWESTVEKLERLAQKYSSRYIRTRRRK